MSDLGKRYVLVTAAYNEGAYIEKTIRSVLAQTRLPQRWVIVSDGSTDRTDEIIQTYAARHSFIRRARIQEEHARNFAAQVHAISWGCQHLQGLDYQFIANVDADVSFEPAYYNRLLEKFDQDPRLGVAGGFICEEYNGKFQSRRMNSVHSVAHAVQMFRRECFEAIGGYVELPYGGPDWLAQVTARMRGWRVEAFRELPVFHHRHTGAADRLVCDLFRQGRMDYSLGSYPPFEIMKVIRRMSLKPYLLGSLIRLTGFLWGYCRREHRPVSEELIQFLRSEQKDVLRSLFSRENGKRASRSLDARV